MADSHKSLTYGRYLKVIRLEKGLSLSEVAQETRISADNLLLIEAEDHAKLPSQVFVKGFIRAYARAIGADEQETIQLYLKSLQESEDSAQFEKDLKRSQAKFWPRLLLSMVALGGMIALTLFVYQKAAHMPSSVAIDEPALIEPQPQNKPAEETMAAEKPTKETPASKPAQNVSSNGLTMKVIATKETWLKVILDGQEPQRFGLSPGNSLELKAGADLNLLIGDAGAIQLSVNGKPVEIIGKDGEAVNIRIP